MNRRDLRKLSTIRLKEARRLLKSGYSCGAYYLAGYAVECALKACIAKGIGRYEFPDKKKAMSCHTHNLNELLGIAGLKTVYDKAVQSRKTLELNWTTVKDWTEESRHNRTIDERKAAELIGAIASRTDGVLKWIREHW